MSEIKRNKKQYLSKCPCCDNNLILKAKNKEPNNILPTDFDLIASHAPPDEPKRPPDKPPGVGDWVVHCSSQSTKAQKIDSIRGDRVYTDGEEDAYFYLDRIRIVRRSTDRLQKGDRGLLDGKIEVWVNNALIDSWLRVVFKVECVKDFAGTDDEFAWVRPDRFTLTKPVFDRKED